MYQSTRGENYHMMKATTIRIPGTRFWKTLSSLSFRHTQGQEIVASTPEHERFPHVFAWSHSSDANQFPAWRRGGDRNSTLTSRGNIKPCLIPDGNRQRSAVHAQDSPRTFPGSWRPSHRRPRATLIELTRRHRPLRSKQCSSPLPSWNCLPGTSGAATPGARGRRRRRTASAQNPRHCCCRRTSRRRPALLVRLSFQAHRRRFRRCLVPVHAFSGK